MDAQADARVQVDTEVADGGRRHRGIAAGVKCRHLAHHITSVCAVSRCIRLDRRWPNHAAGNVDDAVRQSGLEMSDRRWPRITVDLGV
jgi:hypothetical protein